MLAKYKCPHCNTIIETGMSFVNFHCVKCGEEIDVVKNLMPKDKN